MAEPFVGEVRMFAGDFAPRGWAYCNGQILPIAQNQALFSLLGTTYGGDGRTTFGLPDLQGRHASHAGRGPGLSDRRQGEPYGAAEVTLAAQQIPSHDHALNGTARPAQDTHPGGAQIGAAPDPAFAGAAAASMAPASVGAAGGGQPHENQQPYLVVGFIIALVGVYPSRS